MKGKTCIPENLFATWTDDRLIRSQQSKDEAGPDQQTPNIAAVVQEIVNRSGWSNGNSLVIIIYGTGERTAESYDGNPAAAPLRLSIPNEISPLVPK